MTHMISCTLSGPEVVPLWNKYLNTYWLIAGFILQNKHLHERRPGFQTSVIYSCDFRHIWVEIELLSHKDFWGGLWGKGDMREQKQGIVGFVGRWWRLSEVKIKHLKFSNTFWGELLNIYRNLNEYKWSISEDLFKVVLQNRKGSFECIQAGDGYQEQELNVPLSGTFKNVLWSRHVPNLYHI